MTDAVCPPLDSTRHINSYLYRAARGSRLVLALKCARGANIHPQNIELYAVEIQKDFLSKQLQKLQTT